MVLVNGTGTLQPSAMLLSMAARATPAESRQDRYSCQCSGYRTGGLVALAAQQRRRHYIREWRKFRGLTLEQVAQRAGMSVGNISQLERGAQGYSAEGLARIMHEGGELGGG